MSCFKTPLSILSSPIARKFRCIPSTSENPAQEKAGSTNEFNAFLNYAGMNLGIEVGICYKDI